MPVGTPVVSVGGSVTVGGWPSVIVGSGVGVPVGTPVVSVGVSVTVGGCASVIVGSTVGVPVSTGVVGSIVVSAGVTVVGWPSVIVGSTVGVPVSTGVVGSIVGVPVSTGVVGSIVGVPVSTRVVGPVVGGIQFPMRTVTSRDPEKLTWASAGVVGLQPSRVSSVTRYSPAGSRLVKTVEPPDPVACTAKGTVSW